VSLIDKILRAGEGRTLKKLDRLASQVDALAEDFEEPALDRVEKPGIGFCRTA